MHNSLDDELPLHFHNMTRVTAMKLFREGKPHPFVDLKVRTAILQKVHQFVEEVEKSDRGAEWLKIPPLALYSDSPVPPSPTITRPSPPSPSTLLKKKRAKEAAERRKRKREQQAQRREEMRLRKKQMQEAKEAKVKEQKRQHNLARRRRRATIRAIDERVEQLQNGVESKLQEEFESFKQEVVEELAAKIQECDEKIKECETKLKECEKPRRKRRKKTPLPPTVTAPPPTVTAPPPTVTIPPPAVKAPSPPIMTAPPPAVTAPAPPIMTGPTPPIMTAHPRSIMTAPPPRRVSVHPSLRQLPPAGGQSVTVALPSNMISPELVGCYKADTPRYSIHSYPPREIVPRGSRRHGPRPQQHKSVRRTLWTQQSEDSDDYYWTADQRDVYQRVRYA